MKNFAKALLVVSLLAGAGMTSQVAMAAVIPADTGSLAATSQALVIDGTASTYVSTFGRTFTTGLNKLFSDSYTFNVLGDSETSGTVSATFTSSQDLYIKSFDIYDSATNLVVVGGTNELNSNGTKKNDFWSLPELSTLGAGSYYVLVTGQILGTAGGVYGGTLNVTAVTAVPEAETYAMMLAGLGLLGVVARRKAAKKAA